MIATAGTARGYTVLRRPFSIADQVAALASAVSASAASQGLTAGQIAAETARRTWLRETATEKAVCTTELLARHPHVDRSVAYRARRTLVDARLLELDRKDAIGRTYYRITAAGRAALANPTATLKGAA